MKFLYKYAKNKENFVENFLLFSSLYIQRKNHTTTVLSLSFGEQSELR